MRTRPRTRPRPIRGDPSKIDGGGETTKTETTTKTASCRTRISSKNVPSVGRKTKTPETKTPIVSSMDEKTNRRPNTNLRYRLRFPGFRPRRRHAIFPRISSTLVVRAATRSPRPRRRRRRRRPPRNRRRIRRRRNRRGDDDGVSRRRTRRALFRPGPRPPRETACRTGTPPRTGPASPPSPASST